MKVIDARTAKKYQDVRSILDIDLSSDDWFAESDLAQSILKIQAKEDLKVQKLKEMKELREFNSTPSNFYEYGVHSRNIVRKENDDVVLSTIIESNIKIKNFNDNRHFGCEFIRPVKGFFCRLCSLTIAEEKQVLAHIGSKIHKKKYSYYLAKNKDFEEKLKKGNKDILEALAEHGNSIIITESKNAEKSVYLCKLDEKSVHVPNMRDWGYVRERKEKETTEKNEDTSVDEKTSTEEMSEDKNESVEENDMDEESAPVDKRTSTEDMSEDKKESVEENDLEEDEEKEDQEKSSDDQDKLNDKDNTSLCQEDMQENVAHAEDEDK